MTLLNAQKMEHMQENLHFLADSEQPANHHTFYVETQIEAAKFNPAETLDTHPELLSRAFNRPRIAQLEEVQMANVENPKEVRAAERSRTKRYRELAIHAVREKALKRIRQDIERKQALSGKGKRVRVKKATGDQPAQFRFKRERKR